MCGSPDGSGTTLRWLRANDVAAPALMISGHGTIAEAVEATRAGAFDFFEKPPRVATKSFFRVEAMRSPKPSSRRKSTPARDRWGGA